jgi:DNA-binding MarR family transcriptional regulator
VISSVSGAPSARLGRAAELRNALLDLRVELSILTHRVATITRLKDADLDVLDILSREGPQSPTALVRRTGIHAATMTGVLARLENAGWVVRRPDAADRRAVQIESTGFDALTEIFRAGDLRLDEIAAQLSTEDSAVVMSFLLQVRGAVRRTSTAIEPSAALAAAPHDS